MSTTVRVPINGDTLKWARTVASIHPEILAKAAGVSPQRLEAWESEKEQPTHKQARRLAVRLDRSLAFLLAPPPKQSDVPETIDFRGRGSQELPDRLIRETRRAQEHRETLLELEGDPPRIAVSRITWANAPTRAQAFRELLGLKDTFVPPSRGPNDVFNFWRGLIESKGYLIFQTTGIPLDTFKGLSLEHSALPIILVNGADAANSKVFTIFHELAHLTNRTSGVCLLRDDVKEEAVANRFAAQLLMPESQARAVATRLDASVEGVESFAYAFRVSNLAAAYRLKDLGYVDDALVAEVEEQSRQTWEAYQAALKSKKGSPMHWRLRYRDLGSRYVGSVARAVEEDRVDWLEATYLLNARIPDVQRMFNEYYRTGGD